MARLVPGLLRVLLLTFPATWANANERSATLRQEGNWCVCETEHYEVWSSSATGSVKATGVLCESIHESLREIWCSESAEPNWKSQCVVVLHARAEDYACAVAQPGTRSVGCTTLQVDHGKVTFRRIDIRCDRPNWRSSALPHELTHAVLADRLSGHPLPLWADEGLAVLSEAPTTRRAREAVLMESVQRGRQFRVRELLAQGELPAPERRDLFYSQSAMLVALLIERVGPAGFLAYVERADSVGDDAALRECCGIDGVAGLDRLAHARANAALAGIFDAAADKTAIAARETIRSAKN